MALPPQFDFNQVKATRRKKIELKLQALPAQGRVPSCVPRKIVKNFGGWCLGCRDARELPLGQAAYPLSKPGAQIFL